jgi:uncharacterized membrane protein YidH (DUF202 family)
MQALMALILSYLSASKSLSRRSPTFALAFAAFAFAMDALALAIVPAQQEAFTHKVVVARFLASIEESGYSFIMGAQQWYEALRQLNPGIAVKFVKEIARYRDLQVITVII